MAWAVLDIGLPSWQFRNVQSQGNTFRTILVTGASGQLGRRLVPRLIDEGYRVRAHYRSLEKARKYCPANALPVIGDLRQPDWLKEATKSCEIVVHAAALVSLRAGRDREAYEINVNGTKAVVEGCVQNGVSRLIYVSTVATIGASVDGKLLDEAAVFNLGGLGIPYVDTKREAETVALEACKSGLEVIVVNPSIMISMPDRELSSSDLRKIPHWLPVYFDFGLNLVDTNDVVSAIIASIKKGRSGERYLLTGDNIDADKAFQLSQKYFGLRKPILKLPIWALMPAATIAELIASIRGKHPKLHRGLVRLGRYRFVYNNAKARRELGFDPQPLEKTLERILQKINQNPKTR